MVIKLKTIILTRRLERYVEFRLEADYKKIFER